MRPFLSLVLIALLAFISAPLPAHADALLLHNGRILTAVDAPKARQWADALLIVDGRVATIGREADVRRAARKLVPPPTERDLQGAFAMPGLIDAHGHVVGLGQALRRLRFAGTTSAEQIVGMVAEATRSRPKGEWIFGRGWDQNDWAVKQFPTGAMLDPISPEHPVWLRRVDGHAGWANGLAMKLAGITRDTRDPDGGRIERDANGEPTGVFVDNAMALVSTAIPPPTYQQTRSDIVDGLKECARLGLTGVHDAGVDTDMVRAYRELESAGALPVRVAAMLSSGAVLHESALALSREPGPEGAFRVFAIKAYADGALGSRGAALLAPYADDPKNIGLLVTSADTLELLARKALAAKLSLCTHAIGDRGNRVALDACERAAGRATALKGKRFRIEHAQVVSLDDIPRFGRAGIIASMQPTHCTSDMPWAPDRVGTARIEGAYAWRRMLTAGVRLAFGSDFPVEEVNPLHGIHAAVTTQDLAGAPPAGFRPSEKLSIWETLYGFTNDAAYAAFMEKEVGRLSPGFRGDVSVFDQDLTAIPFADLPRAKCVLTIVGGKVTWDAGAAVGAN